MTGPGLPLFTSALAVVAHPDDESFGLGALLAAVVAGGGIVDVVCFTRGEASTLGMTDDLAARRARELDGAAAALGVRRAHIGELPDGGLATLAPVTLDEFVQAGARRPQAVVVFEPSGVTGHPDHRAATAAGQRFAEEHGLIVVQWGVHPSVAAALNDEFGTSFSGLDGPGVREVPVDRSRQLQAIACHGSQSTDNPVLRRRLELSGDIEVVRIVASGDDGAIDDQPSASPSPSE